MSKLRGMLNGMRFLTVLAGGFGLAISAPAGSKASGANTKPYTALYVFGDSYSDTGARYLDGNGPTAVAYFAEVMGIPLTHSRDPNVGGKSLNFAATGGTSGEDTGKGPWCCQGMMDQV